jgi:hypothetical protein
MLSSFCTTLAQANQDNYKHPNLNASGKVSNEKGEELGWISKEGIIFNAKGERIAFIKGTEVTDANGKKIGKVEKNGAYYNTDGQVVFTIEPNSKGERCKVFDPNGKVIATVHESYKNQACAIHCLTKKMPMN